MSSMRYMEFFTLVGPSGAFTSAISRGMARGVLFGGVLSGRRSIASRGMARGVWQGAFGKGRFVRPEIYSRARLQLTEVTYTAYSRDSTAGLKFYMYVCMSQVLLALPTKDE